MIKKKLAKKQRQNRPIPILIRMRIDNTISTAPSVGIGAALKFYLKPFHRLFQNISIS
ncbi:hypothetical protein Leryth_012075 [Lithospermum erythrorhizon]|nr:hypothetical protein Leryth_012075 [Lithospermum erythrorhizon]